VNVWGNYNMTPIETWLPELVDDLLRITWLSETAVTDLYGRSPMRQAHLIIALVEERAHFPYMTIQQTLESFHLDPSKFAALKAKLKEVEK